MTDPLMPAGLLALAFTAWYVLACTGFPYGQCRPIHRVTNYLRRRPHRRY